jgi:hypothetical protein
MPRKPAASKRKKTYKQMITEAIIDHASRKGCSQIALEKYILAEIKKRDYKRYYLRAAIKRGKVNGTFQVHHNHKNSIKLPPKKQRSPTVQKMITKSIIEITNRKADKVMPRTPKRKRSAGKVMPRTPKRKRSAGKVTPRTPKRKRPSETSTKRKKRKTEKTDEVTEEGQTTSEVAADEVAEDEQTTLEVDADEASEDEQTTLEVATDEAPAEEQTTSEVDADEAVVEGQTTSEVDADEVVEEGQTTSEVDADEAVVEGQTTSEIDADETAVELSFPQTEFNSRDDTMSRPSASHWCSLSQQIMIEVEHTDVCRYWLRKLFPWCRRWVAPSATRVISVTTLSLHTTTHTTH